MGGGGVLVWRARRWGPRVTRAEFRLRRALEKEGLLFLTQKVLQGRERRHCVDFYFPPDLVVEVDGSSHVKRQLLKDEAATADLENAVLPFRVLRFRDGEIWKDVAGVVACIKKALRLDDECDAEHSGDRD